MQRGHGNGSGADKQPYFMRLLSWLEGDVFVNTLPHGEALLALFGRGAG